MSAADHLNKQQFPVIEEMPKDMQYQHRLRSFGTPFRVSMYEPGVGEESGDSYFKGRRGLVGFVDAYREPETGNVNVGYMSTRPGHERQGIASRLTEIATKDAPEVDMGEIMHNASGAITKRMLDAGRKVRYKGQLRYP